MRGLFRSGLAGLTGWTIIFGAFGKRLPGNPASNKEIGEPKDAASLFSVYEIRSDFSGYAMPELQDTRVYLIEGAFHNGGLPLSGLPGKSGGSLHLIDTPGRRCSIHSLKSDCRSRMRYQWRMSGCCSAVLLSPW